MKVWARNSIFWRTYDRQEIDLVEESSESLTALSLSGGTKKRMYLVFFKEAYPNATFDAVNKNNYLSYI